MVCENFKQIVKDKSQFDKSNPEMYEYSSQS